MNIYLLSQDIVNGWDTYDSCVVVAENEIDARATHPSEHITHHRNGKWMGTYTGGDNIGGEYENESCSWVSFVDVSRVDVKLIGVASDHIKKGVICSSFNAG